MNSALSLLPPFIAILLAMATRRVLLSLFAGLFAGTLVLGRFSPVEAVTGLFVTIYRVVFNSDNACLLLFSLLIGALVRLVQDSGGVHGFVTLLTHKNLIDSRRKTRFFAALLGTVLFIEGSISILTVGTVVKPLFKKFRIAAEKLAYIADSTCAPVAVLIPLNGWGAYLVTQLKGQQVQDPVAVLVSAMPYFFYPMFAMVAVMFSVFFEKDWGPMKKAEQDAANLQPTEEASAAAAKPEDRLRSVYFILPMLTLIAGLFLFMKLTGNGDIRAGDGARSVLYATFAAIATAFFMYRGGNVMSARSFADSSMKGMKHLFGVVMILVFALSINAVCRELQTGRYIAGLVGPYTAAVFIPVLIFIISAVISFSTGTSWGTFAIMLSIGVPLSVQLQLDLPLIVGAIVSGGVWGDHTSPISDTTVLSSLASDCDHISHVRTQLPYALFAGGLSAAAFLIAGLL